MKMWPQSQNISAMPPPVRKIPGRLSKNRKKEQGETNKKTRKLSKKGIEMLCNTCHNKGHNKRKCSRGAPATDSNANPGPSLSSVIGSSAGPISAASPTVGRGRGGTRVPKVSPTERGRGRPKDSTEKGGASTSRPRIVGIGVLHTQSGCTIINICFI